MFHVKARKASSKWKSKSCPNEAREKEELSNIEPIRKDYAKQTPNSISNKCLLLETTTIDQQTPKTAIDYSVVIQSFLILNFYN